MGGKLLVVAIDFGTSYCGYAFSYRHEYERDPLKISTNAAWNTGDRGLFSWKTPTTILLKPDQSFDSFGFEAEDKYCELAEEDEHHEWYYYRRFKMLLHNKLQLTKDTMLEDAMGKQMPAKTIFTLAIRYMMEHFLGLQHRQGIDITEEDIMWVITVPAIWDKQFKQFMTEAAVDAGIPSKQLRVALEPEVASIYCRSAPLKLQISTSRQSCRLFETGTRYMILDAGGCTVGVTVHEIKTDGTLKEVHKASSGAWGGNKVNESYFEFLKAMFGHELMGQFKRDSMNEYLDMVRVFEEAKRTVKDTSDKVSVHVSAAFNEFVKEKTGLSTREMVIKAGYSDTITFRRERMQINSQVFKNMFEPSISSIIDQVKEILENPKVHSVDMIMMVGGFAECDLVTRSIKNAFRHIDVIVPVEPGLAVLKGAVMFGHAQGQIDSQVDRFTNGVAVEEHFIKDYRSRDNRVQKGNGAFCKGLFGKLIEVDSEAGMFEMIKKSYYIAEVSQSYRSTNTTTTQSHI